MAGASGAIGRPLVGALLEAGHDVIGLTRRDAAAEAIRAQGAEAVVCDALDRAALQAAVVDTRPDTVVHQLTSYPARLDMRKPGVYGPTNRLRREGTHNLIAAARAAGASRVVAQSIAFIYAPIGGWVKTEDDPVIENPGGEFGGALAAALDLERQVLESEPAGLVLRFGFLYGPGTWYASDGHQAEDVRRRRLPIVGDGSGTFSFVHVDDAAAATAAACERGAPGIYNVCDDEPAPMRDWVPVYAEAVGAPKPLRVPKLLARLVAGRAVAESATTLRGAANDKAKHELGWRPLIPSWRRGFRDALG